MVQGSKFSAASHRMKPGTLVLIGLFHVLAIYGLAKAFAPDITSYAERTVLAAFTVTVTAPDEPAPEAKQEEGGAADPGKKAVPRPVAAPPPKLALNKDRPAPRASSTGTKTASGAKDEGDGTGATGSGFGTGSGHEGGGQGGVFMTKPVHISGGIDNARDYPVPPGGRQARRGNEVIVKVTVGINGRATKCGVYKPSRDAEADQITCQLVMERLGFKPAMDARGNPVPAPFYWRQRWF